MIKLFLKQMKGYLWALVVIVYLIGLFWQAHNIFIAYDVKAARISFLLYAGMMPLVGLYVGIYFIVKDIRNRWLRARKEYYGSLLRSIEKLEGKIHE